MSADRDLRRDAVIDRAREVHKLRETDKGAEYRNALDRLQDAVRSLEASERPRFDYSPALGLRAIPGAIPEGAGTTTYYGDTVHGMVRHLTHEENALAARLLNEHFERGGTL